jgi:hypothetical protein
MAEARLGCELSETSSSVLLVEDFPTGGYDKGEVAQVNGQWGFIFSWASDSEDSIRYAPSVLLITKARVVVGAKAAVTVAAGDEIYFDESENNFTNVSSGNIYFGSARKNAAQTDTEVEFEFDRTGDL